MALKPKQQRKRDEEHGGGHRLLIRHLQYVLPAFLIRAQIKRICYGIGRKADVVRLCAVPEQFLFIIVERTHIVLGHELRIPVNSVSQFFRYPVKGFYRRNIPGIDHVMGCSADLPFRNIHIIAVPIRLRPFHHTPFVQIR